MCKIKEKQALKDSQILKGSGIEEQAEDRLVGQRQELAERRSNLWSAGQQIAVQMLC